MKNTFIKFLGGSSFLVTSHPGKVRREKIPYFLFFDRDEISRYFHFPQELKDSPFKGFYLQPTTEGIEKITKTDGTFYVVDVNFKKLFPSPEEQHCAEIASFAKQNGFLILTEEAISEGTLVKTESFLCRIFYGLIAGKPFPVSYSPFMKTVKSVDALKGKTAVLSFGDENDFTLAHQEDGEITISSNLGSLQSFYEIEEMDRLVNDVMGHLQMKNVPLLRGFNNYSLIANYLRRFPEVYRVNHLFAHLAATAADNEMAEEEIVGVVYDSVSNGPDNRIQGGDFVTGKLGSFKLSARWKAIPLPGGDMANVEPWRISLALLREIFGAEEVEKMELKLLKRIRENSKVKYLYSAILRGDIPYTPTSSMHHIIAALGELLWFKAETFDMNYFESLMNESKLSGSEYYEIPLFEEEGLLKADTYVLFEKVIEDLKAQKPAEEILQKAMNCIADVSLQVVKRISGGKTKVVLSGDTLKNSAFSELLLKHFSDGGFEVVMNRRVPADDSCISIGQILCYYSGQFEE